MICDDLWGESFPFLVMICDDLIQTTVNFHLFHDLKTQHSAPSGAWLEVVPQRRDLRSQNVHRRMKGTGHAFLTLEQRGNRLYHMECAINDINGGKTLGDIHTHTHIRTHTHTHRYIYIYICVYIYLYHFILNMKQIKKISYEWQNPERPWYEKTVRNCCPCEQLHGEKTGHNGKSAINSL